MPHDPVEVLQAVDAVDNLAARFPKWKVTIRRSDVAPYLVGECGCGWLSSYQLRTVHIAEQWDEHMILSIDKPDLHKKGEDNA